MIKVKYNTPIEVSKSEYDALMINCAGLIAGRFDYEEEKYYIKVWMMSCAEYVESYLWKNRNGQIKN